MSKDASITNNLIINYLPQFLTDDEFKNMFLSIGPLKSFKIVRDKSTGFSYGFGFIEYDADNDAERAVKVFDGLCLYGKRIRVQHANKTDDLSSGHNIYVKNIPTEWAETDLDKLFEPFGKIVTSKVLMDLQTGQSRNVGFVLFETKAEADKAISELNGKSCPGSKNTLLVKYADDAAKKAKVAAMAPVLPHVMPQSPAQFQPPLIQGNGFTPPSAPPGPMRNQSGNRFRFNPMARENPVGNFGPQNFNTQNFNNTQVSSNFGMNNPKQNFNMNASSPASSLMTSPRVDIPQGVGPFSIFIYNIGDDAEERELWALFSPFGTVNKCTVMMDAERRSCKGFGFVDMANAMEAASAIQNLNGFLYKGKQLLVSFKNKKRSEKDL